MESSEVIGDDLRRYLREKLRSNYIYPKHDVIEDYVQQCGRNLTDMIEAQMPQMDASHARANLLTLPAELRNCIYELVPSADRGIECPDGRYMIEIADPSDEEPWTDEGYMPACFSTKGWCTQPPLTRVSRQVRAETLPVYFSANTFVIYVEGDWPLNVAGSEEWFRDMPKEYHRLIKNLKVRFCVNSSTVGLSGRRMARVLHQLKIGVAEDAVSSWAAPEIKYTGRGEFRDWVLVPEIIDELKKRHQEEVEGDFCNYIGSCAWTATTY